MSPETSVPSNAALKIASSGRIGSIALPVEDLEHRAEFWQAALGHVRRDGKSDDFVLLGPSDGCGGQAGMSPEKSGHLRSDSV